MNRFTQKIAAWNRKLNLHVVTYFSTIDVALRSLTILISLLVITTLCYYHGFDLSTNMVKKIDILLNTCAIFYLFKYFLYTFYSVKRKNYFKQHIVSGVLILFLLINIFLIPLLSSELNLFVNESSLFSMNAIYQYYAFFLQLFFLIFSVAELLKSCTFLNNLNISTSGLMLLSFLLLISIGTVLLMMPRMTTSPITFIDALFTSTSASCVTGLTVLNTGTDFTLRGHIVILMLIQFGGLNILAFATFFSSILTRTGSFSLKQNHLMKDMFNTSKTKDSIARMREIIVTTLLIELVGVTALFFYWKGTHTFLSTEETFFQALFHTVSAFNNAGFSLWNDNLANPIIARSYFPQFIIMGLIILGGIGFFVIQDVFSHERRQRRREIKWQKLKPSTYIVLYTTAFIIIIGTLCFFVLEYNFSLYHLPPLEKFAASLFQVVTSRTTGFNTVDMSLISLPALLVIMIIMFIGASPGSTGGGIKTTTAFVIFKSIVATIKGYRRVEFSKKTIPIEIASKSYSIVVMSVLIVVLSVVALAITDRGQSLTDLLFESVSAFSTTGLSLGITANLSDAGKFILILNMFIGRIGTLSIALALSKSAKTMLHKYPSTYIMVG